MTNQTNHIILRSVLADIFGGLADTLKAQCSDSTADICNTPTLFRQTEPEERLTTPWPKLVVDSDGQGLWDLAVARQTFELGDVVRLYTAGCSGLANLAQRLQLPLFKVGVTQQSDLLVRQRELQTDRYAGHFKRHGKYALDQNFDDWEIRQIDTCNIPDLPFVSLTPRALVIQLPVSLTFRQFEQKLDELLAPISLSNWIDTDDGKRHLTALQLDAGVAERFTIYNFGSSSRISRASELCICRPRDDVPKIAALISRHLCDHLAAQPAIPL